MQNGVIILSSPVKKLVSFRFIFQLIISSLLDCLHLWWSTDFTGALIQHLIYVSVLVSWNHVVSFCFPKLKNKLDISEIIQMFQMYSQPIWFFFSFFFFKKKLNTNYNSIILILQKETITFNTQKQSLILISGTWSFLTVAAVSTDVSMNVMTQ